MATTVRNERLCISSSVHADEIMEWNDLIAVFSTEAMGQMIL
jgi:hypothetical protein